MRYIKTFENFQGNEIVEEEKSELPEDDQEESETTKDELNIEENEKEEFDNGLGTSKREILSQE